MCRLGRTCESSAPGPFRRRGEHTHDPETFGPTGDRRHRRRRCPRRRPNASATAPRRATGSTEIGASSPTPMSVEAIDEVALGLAELGIEPGDRVGDPRRHPAGMDAGQLWDLSRGRRRRPRLPDQLRPGVRVGARQLRRRAVVCENAEQVAKIEEVRDELPELETIISIEPGAGDLTLAELRERGARARSGGAGRSAGRRQARGRVHDHLHVGHHRAAEGGRADPPQRDVGVRDGGGDRVHLARARSRTCSCPSPTRSR